MLFSLKALTPGFLRLILPEKLYPERGTLKVTIDSVKAYITMSTKFVVGHELLLIGKEWHEIGPMLYGKDYTKTSYVPKNKEQKLFSVWKEFAKLPFDCIFIENSTGGLLLVKEHDNILFCSILENGAIQPFIGVIKKEAFDESKLASAFISNKLMDYIHNNFLDTEEEKINRLTNVAGVVGLMILNVLTYINTKNISITKYTPSNKELTKVPKVIRKNFDYHIVNIFHKQKVYDSLAAVEKYSEEEISSNTRAHMVRGHFKTRSTGLYWWNPFLRCKKNEGFVDKDYAVH